MTTQDIRDAVDYALNSYDGEPVYVSDSTIVVGMDSEGRYWVADNGEEVNGIDYDGVLDYCLESLAF